MCLILKYNRPCHVPKPADDYAKDCKIICMIFLVHRASDFVKIYKAAGINVPCVCVVCSLTQKALCEW